MTPASRRPGESGHERRLADEGRRAELGAWYTPPPVVDGLLGLSLDPLLADCAGDVSALEALRVVDPACGDGRFLVASARRIAAAIVAAGSSGPDAWTAAARCVIGVDRDPEAAALAVASLAEVVADGGGSMPAGPCVVVDDAIAMDEPPWAFLVGVPQRFLPPLKRRGSRWTELPGATMGFDLVVGNPPFLGQLKKDTRASPQDRAARRARFGDLVSAFTDVAAMFLLLAEQLARPDRGVIALVLPIPLLATRDGAPIRRHVLARTELAHLWVADERAFAARVEVCAAVLVRPSPAVRVPPRTHLWSRLTFVPGPLADAPTAASATWSGPLATHAGVPERTLAVAGVLGDRASATAGFRDQYYGLTGCVLDQRTPSPGRDEPRLVTSGSIDPACMGWGDTPVRFQKVELLHPRVQIDRLSETMQQWVRRQLVPKVLVSTQTRVLEAVVDLDGTLVPSVPLVSIYATTPDPDELDRIGALLTSPAITVLATRRHAGSGFGGRSLRLRAGDLLALPVPADHERWGAAAAWFREASEAEDADERHVALMACGRAMNEAFGLGPDLALLRWWMERLPGRRERLGTLSPGR